MKRSIAFESAGSAAKRPEICLDLLDLPQTVLEILVRYALESIGSTCRRVMGVGSRCDQHSPPQRTRAAEHSLLG
jgi:hypothetical protein